MHLSETGFKSGNEYKWLSIRSNGGIWVELPGFIVTEDILKDAIFWDVAPFRSCVSQRFGGTYRLHLQGRKICKRGTSVNRWLSAASKTSVHTRSTWLQIPEDGILHSHCHENLKSYKRYLKPGPDLLRIPVSYQCGRYPMSFFRCKMLIR
jgi:hypothetical protein